MTPCLCKYHPVELVFLSEVPAGLRHRTHCMTSRNFRNSARFFVERRLPQSWQHCCWHNKPTHLLLLMASVGAASERSRLNHVVPVFSLYGGTHLVTVTVDSDLLNHEHFTCSRSFHELAPLHGSSEVQVRFTAISLTLSMPTPSSSVFLYLSCLKRCVRYGVLAGRRLVPTTRGQGYITSRRGSGMGCASRVGN